MVIKKVLPIVIIAFAIILMLYFGLGYLSSAIGWYGYDKDKPRRDTSGDISESKEREVYIKSLEYIKERKDTISFVAYIEKGFRYGKNSSKKTRLLENSKYPYQFCMTSRIDNESHNISFSLENKKIFDSSYYSIDLLKKPYIKDTIYVSVQKLNDSLNKWETINKIKIWDNNVNLPGNKQHR